MMFCTMHNRFFFFLNPRYPVPFVCCNACFFLEIPLNFCQFTLGPTLYLHTATANHINALNTAACLLYQVDQTFAQGDTLLKCTTDF